MCKKSEKAIDHLLLYYEVARNFTVLVFCLFGMEWVMPQRVVEFLVDWRDKLGSHRLEDGSLMLNVVYLKRMQCLKF